MLAVMACHPTPTLIIAPLGVTDQWAKACRDFLRKVPIMLKKQWKVRDRSESPAAAGGLPAACRAAQGLTTARAPPPPDRTSSRRTTLA